MTHLWGISKAAAETNVAAEAKVKANLPPVPSPAFFECQSTLRGHSKTVTSVAWKNDGTKLASCSDDKSVKIWNVITNKWTLKNIWQTMTGQLTLSGQKDPVRSVCFSPCGTKIVSGGGMGKNNRGNEDFSIRILDAERGTQIGSPLTGHSDW
jgi:WD40 repeat protein